MNALEFFKSSKEEISNYLSSMGIYDVDIFLEVKDLYGFINLLHLIPSPCITSFSVVGHVKPMAFSKRSVALNITYVISGVLMCIELTLQNTRPSKKKIEVILDHGRFITQTVSKISDPKFGNIALQYYGPLGRTVDECEKNYVSWCLGTKSVIEELKGYLSDGTFQEYYNKYRYPASCNQTPNKFDVAELLNRQYKLMYGYSDMNFDYEDIFIISSYSIVIPTSKNAVSREKYRLMTDIQNLNTNLGRAEILNEIQDWKRYLTMRVNTLSLIETAREELDKRFHQVKAEVAKEFGIDVKDL